MSLIVHRSPRAAKPLAPMPVRMEMIGGPAAGKTALCLAIVRYLVGCYFPSGLYFGAGPKELAEAEAKLWKRIQDLRERALQSTLDEVQIHYQVSDGEALRIEFATHECCGQTLTETTPSSPADQQQRYQQLLQRLSLADVLWLPISPPPPSPTRADMLRFETHLRLALAYLQTALRERTSNRPVCVAGVITKLDTLFETPEQAREVFTDDYLEQALRPFVQAVRQSRRVTEAILCPTSAFGWKNAELVSVDDEPGPTSLLGVEPTWILRPDAVIDPYNIGGLMAWTLLAGILHQEVQIQGADEAAMSSVAQMLAADLAAFQAWLVPIKGEIL